MHVRLYQNGMTNDQLERLEPGFELLDFRHNPRPELREFQIFDALHERGAHRSADIVGAVSMRFGAKSLLDGRDVRGWIEREPGLDVYIVNPMPQLAYMNFNHWRRASELRDVEFQGLSQRVLDRAGVALNCVDVGRQHNGNFACCSFWFGSARFWDGLMRDVVRPVLALGPTDLDSELSAFLYEPIAYYGDARHRPGGLVFLLERATTLYVEAAFRRTRRYYSFTREGVLARCLFPFERDCVTHYGDRVDAWDADGVYPDEAMDYFRLAGRMCSFGWRTYFHIHPIDFDHGDPRPALPWSRGAARG